MIRNAINAGQIPGPRYLAASQEITVAGGLGDEMLPHLPFPEFSFGVVVNGAEEMRKAVRMFLKYGVDSIKLNLSGDNFAPDAPADTTWMSDEEVAVAVDEAQVRGKRGAAHARSCESVKQALRHGIDVIYHASFTDEEALDMLEAAKDKHLRRARHRASSTPCCTRPSPGASPHARRSQMGYELESDAARRVAEARCTSAASACCPAATTASPSRRTARTPRDLEFFVKYLGFTPMEAICLGHAATAARS